MVGTQARGVFQVGGVDHGRDSVVQEGGEEGGAEGGLLVLEGGAFGGVEGFPVRSLAFFGAVILRAAAGMK